MVSPTDGDKPNDRDELRKLVRRVTSLFAIPPGEKIFSPLTQAEALVTGPFAEIAAAFRANVEGLISTTSMPFTLADRSTHDRHWQRFIAVERIRSLDEIDQAQEQNRDEQALANARAEMERFLKSPESTDLIIRDTLGFLDGFRSNEMLIGAANELMLQGVLCWGAFEVMARDCFIAHLNANPAKSLTLVEDSGTRRRFELSKLPLETLAAHNFDLSARMGTLLAKQQDMSDLNSIKAVYQALFPEQRAMTDALNDPDLRILSLRRNVIVHRRGIIDEQYVSSANCSQPVGERLKLSPRELHVHLGAAIKVTSVILGAVSVN